MPQPREQRRSALKREHPARAWRPRALTLRAIVCVLSLTADACERRAAVERRSASDRAAVSQHAASPPDGGGARKPASGSDHSPAIARAEAGSTEQGAPAIGLLLVAQAVPRVTDLEFVPTRPELLVATGQDGKAVLLDLHRKRGAVARPKATVLEVSVDNQSEMGLLAITFHPHYAENGRLFVHYNPKGLRHTRIVELALPLASLGAAPPRERRVLIELAQPYRNHNGGELAFGPDGKLYVGLGDGGSGGDPHGNGQNRGTLLGKILRLDVDADTLVPADNPFVQQAGARPEIFAYGLRNPWKFSFDPRGRLVVADVGQNRFEEIDLVGADDNMGWNSREAGHCFQPRSGCAKQGLVDPVFEYGRELGGSVTGGYVYTGNAVPALAGRYVFGDFLSRRLWALELPEQHGQRARATALGVFEPASASIGRDANGELYVSDYGSGRVFKLVSP